MPKGLVGVIAPWNYPLTMAISDGLAALVAGNAVLLKPDQQTPLVALAAVELLRSSACPPTCGRWCTDRATQVGPQLIDESRLRLLHRVDGHRAQGRHPVRRAG